MISLGRKGGPGMDSSKHNAYKDTKASSWETSEHWESGGKWAYEVFLEPDCQGSWLFS